MGVGAIEASVPSLVPQLDAAALTKAVVGAATGQTEVAVDLAQVAAAGTAPPAAQAGTPSAEDIAAVQQALGLASAVAGRSGASSLA